ARQDGGLVDGRQVQAEGLRRQAQEIVGIDLGGDDLARDDVALLDAAQQAANEGGLAGAHLARDDDEALLLVQPVLEESASAAVPPAAEEEVGIRCQLERSRREAEELLVHALASVQVFRNGSPASQ